MNIIEAAQGSQQWLDIRAKHFTASEAPAMLGLSKYKTRQALLREKATGLTEEVDANKQRLFDAGHAAEEAARPLAEAYLQEDLFPATGAAEIDGLPLLASFDGLNMEETLVWENKLASVSVEAMISGGDLSGTYWPQVEQQLLVSGAERALFTACDGERITDKLWYESKPERRAQLIAGWKQFAEDLANYQHVEAAPVATAAPINELPALMVEITGSVTTSNLDQWRDIVTERIAGINTNLQTDQDFADADSMVKFLDDGEKRIDLVKSQAQANAADIDRVFRALDEIKASMRAKRLELDKLVTRRKESIKIEIMQAGKDQFAAHIAGLNKRLAKVQMPPLAADFAAAIKGKRNLESMRGAVADLVAAKKIESNEIADRIQANLVLLDGASEHNFLFSDLSSLVMKAPEYLSLIIKTRIDEHKDAEEKRRAAETARIRAEEDAAREAKNQEWRDAGKEPAAQPALKEVMQAIPPAPVVAAAPIHATAGTARLHDLIDDALRDFNAGELRQVLDAIDAIKAERQAAA
jgi:predicted phage-related endonuclease